jgi:large subunit ribosomal protein L32
MAVPKKKMSKAKRDSRKAVWKRKVSRKLLYAVSLGKSLLDSKNYNFVL